MSGEVACTGKDAVFGDGLLWRTGRRVRHEGVPSQDKALVFQGVFPLLLAIQVVVLVVGAYLLAR